MKQAKRKHKFTTMRFRRNDPEHNLLAATTHWILAHGGRAVVIGGIQVQDWGQAFSFKIEICCTGRKPRGTPEGKKQT